jgi:hypothetical protein
MNATSARELREAAIRRLIAFIHQRGGLPGTYWQAWDRLNALGFDIELRRAATKANAQALLWLAENRVSHYETIR